MPPEHAPHTLLRVAGARALVMPAAPPPWVGASIQRAPWVVIRRDEVRSGLIPVGVRGAHRAERLAAWIDAGTILEAVTPCDLARRHAWRSSPRQCVIPALGALDALDDIMIRHGLEGTWGPTGSVGFELASGCATAAAASDLDLALWTAQPPGVDVACSLLGALESLAVRSDMLLETARGALALAEYAHGGRRVLLRTGAGPRLVNREEVCPEAGATDRNGAARRAHTVAA
jgi:phosphoribosyl-dephospho-CoA transferase